MLFVSIIHRTFVHHLKSTVMKNEKTFLTTKIYPQLLERSLWDEQKNYSFSCKFLHNIGGELLDVDPEVTTLNLYENHLESFNLTLAPTITRIGLADNNISDLRRLDFSNTNVQHLNLSFNNLGGDVDGEMLPKNLVSLNISGNPKIMSLTNFDRLVNLKSLSIGDCWGLDGEMKLPPNLEVLKIDQDNFFKMLENGTSPSTLKTVILTNTQNNKPKDTSKRYKTSLEYIFSVYNEEELGQMFPDVIINHKDAKNICNKYNCFV